jgi:hypothetical protein
MIGMKTNLKEILEIAQSTSDPKTKLQARAIAVDCYKYIMEMTTSGAIVTDAIKYVQTNKEKLTTITTMSSKENDNGKESKEPDYDEDKELEEEQEKETGELNQEETTNQVF